VLDVGKRLTGIVFRATPQGVVSGRILDENGDAVAYAQARLLRFQYTRGRKELVAAGGSASTNDLGEYRIFGISPGKYYLSATYREARARVGGGGRGGGIMQMPDPSPGEDYVPVYYPGTTDPAAAAVIQVTAGGQVSNINLQLAMKRTVRVSGRAAPGTSISLVPRNAVNTNDLRRSAATDRQGNFEISNVIPGSYYLMGVLMQGRQASTSKQPLEVGNSNVEGITVTPAPSVQVSGRVRTDDGQPLPAGQIRISLMPRDQEILAGSANAGRVAEDGSFRLDSVGVDQYDLNVLGMPAGYYLKSARAGGNDVLAAGLDVSGAVNGLEIVISANAGRVTGAVDPPQSVTVVLIPQEPERKSRTAAYRTTGTDENGAFTLNNVPPGRYLAYAWEEIESGAYLDPDYVKPFESFGQPVNVAEKDATTVQMKVIPRPQ
jgi:protocatechuate 3,4-dioxygenase beta subunit